MDTCRSCGEPIVYSPDIVALFKGHVYSLLGKKEIGITGMCEYCWDTSLLPVDYTTLIGSNSDTENDPLCAFFGNCSEPALIRITDDKAWKYIRKQFLGNELSRNQFCPRHGMYMAKNYVEEM